VLSIAIVTSAVTDPELSQWLHWASEGGSTPTFVRTVAKAALIACSTGMADLLLTC
jgi:type II secretory pathway predicted ATPase ExeA